MGNGRHDWTRFGVIIGKFSDVDVEFTPGFTLKDTFGEPVHIYKVARGQ